MERIVGRPRIGPVSARAWPCFVCFSVAIMGPHARLAAGQLVVAISRALFDFEEENQVFEAEDDRAYMQLQLERLERAACRAWPFAGEQAARFQHAGDAARRW